MKSRARIVLACVSVVGLALGLTVPTVSAASVKSYSASLLSPVSVFAGATVTYTFKVTNSTSSTNTLGSLQVAIPSGFSNVVFGSATSPAGAWEGLNPGNCVYGSPSPCPTVIQVDTSASGGTTKLNPGQSVAFTLTATAPRQLGTYAWKTAAKPSTDFSGTSLFALAGAQPSVAVIGAPATALRIGLPTSTTAGQPFSVTVTALDQFGNTATGYAGTIGFSTSDTGGTLPADYAFQLGDAGTHTFINGVTLTAAGAQSLTATDTANSSITGSGSVVVAAAAASRLVLSASSTSTAGSSLALSVTAYDAYGNQASGYAGTVDFSTSDHGPQTTLPAAYTFQPVDAGTHAFTATLTIAGSQTLTVGDGALSTTITVNVGPAAATNLQVSGLPVGNVTAGNRFSATVSAVDQFGNTATTGYTGTVHFTSSDHGTQNALPADYKFTAADAGVHTFSNGFVLTTAGVQSITASDADVNTTVAAGSGGVTVSPAAASRLVLSAPTSAVAGSGFSTTVTAVDQFGNVATGYTGTVQFTSSDHGTQTVLPADYTFTAVDSGIHMFTNGTTLTTAGNQSLTATDKATGSMTGSAVVAVSPGPGHLVIASVADETTGLASPVRGQNFDVVVISRDAFGNPVPVSQPTTVALSIKTGTGTGTLSGTLTSTAPAGSAVWTIAGAQYSKTENGVVLVASTISGDSLTAGQATVNVQALAAVVTGSPGTSVTLGSSACVDATVALPTCATTFFQHGVNGKAFLSEGVCAGVATGCLTNQGSTSLLMNVTANLKDANGQPLYSRTDPALTIVECDKSLCSGRGVTSYHLYIDLNNAGTYVQVPACPSKGVIAPAPAPPFCLDYIQSHRDGAGDLQLYLLFAIDYGVHY